MFLSWFFRSAALILLLTIPLSSWAFSTRTESWTEDALLHDGRVINVSRKVDYTFQFVSGDEASMKLFSSWPDKYSIKFTNPDTQETIKWQGEQYYDPVLLDIVNGVPYLVVLGSPDKDTKTIYGCPEIPYIFLKYEKKRLKGEWIPLQQDKIPSVLNRNANLSPDYDTYYSGNSGSHRSLNDIKDRVAVADRGGIFQTKIPINFDTWGYSVKKSYRNERFPNDCRPARLPPPEVKPIPSQKIVLETLETKNYPTELVINSADWNNIAWDKKRSELCKTLFKPLDPEDPLMAGRELFVNDPTGKKPVPYTKFGVTSLNGICTQDDILLLDYVTEPENVVFTKLTHSGDMIYRISVKRPVDPYGYPGSVLNTTIKHENGYLYFEWWSSQGTAGVMHVKQVIKLRLREPDSRSS